MSIPLPWFAVAISTTLINGLILGFIGWREKNPVLKMWALAWCAWAAAALPMMATAGQPGTALSLVCGTMWVLSSLSFVAGCYKLMGRRTPAAWWVVSTLAVMTALLLGVGQHGPPGMIPLVVFQALGLFGAGILIIHEDRQRIGSWTGGVALLLLGLHVLDAPLFIRDPQLMPWGFVIATGLQIVAALGMVTLHYEKARDRLLETELSLAKNAKIRALGRAAGSVAHDFNNILTIMQGQLDLLQIAREESDKARASTALQQAVDQALRLTSGLLSASHRAPVQLQIIEVDTVVRESLTLLKDSIPERIQLTYHAPNEAISVRGDRALLEQIVMNLISNARNAIVGEGRIEVQLLSLEEPSPHYCLRVQDTGTGINAELQKRIFEPFFTTRETGTGLGLASVQGAVAQLKGTIKVESELNRGSCFEVCLPL
jgi:signal transduction histidine kinase